MFAGGFNPIVAVLVGWRSNTSSCVCSSVWSKPTAAARKSRGRRYKIFEVLVFDDVPESPNNLGKIGVVLSEAWRAWERCWRELYRQAGR